MVCLLTKTLLYKTDDVFHFVDPLVRLHFDDFASFRFTKIPINSRGMLMNKL